MNNWLKKQIIGRIQFFKFLVVGSIGMLIDLGFLYLLVEVFAVHYLWGASISFLVAVVNNFLLNKYWTFGNKQKKYVGQFVCFLLISLAGLAMNLVIMFVLVDKFRLWYILAKIIAILILTLWNYIMNKKITFAEKTVEV